MKNFIGDGTANLVKAIQRHCLPLGGAMREYDTIIEAAEDRLFVMIGEASHGTGEFYKVRAEITMRLITECGFNAVAVEADWPDAYTVNRYVQGLMPDCTAEAALRDFERFPTWMWKNKEVLEFVKWLHAYNHEYRFSKSEKDRAIGFYGLDMYSMGTSAAAVIEYLEKTDKAAARRARERYACLESFVGEPHAYGYATGFGLTKSCEDEIITQLVELRKNAYEYIKKNGMAAEDEYFCAEQNAKLVFGAEKYYRTMFDAHVNSWNIRDRHMFSTLQDIAANLTKRLGREARIVVWAHNSHIGNAAATDMGKRGEVNIGQLARQAYMDNTLLIGFSTCRGSVTAASDWDSYIQRKKIKEPISGSYEEVFHHVNHKNFLLDLRENNEAVDLLMEPRLQRAIGVIYRPDTERHSHYFYSCLPEQFDFIIHFDSTSAIEPLDTAVHWHHGELDETYPTGL